MEKCPCQRGIGYGEQGGEHDRLFHPSILLSPIVKAHNRLGAVCDALHRHGRHLPQGVDDCHNAHIEIPSECLKRRIAHDLHGTVGDCHGKTAHSQSHNGPDSLPLRTQAGQPEAQYGSFSCQETHNPDSGKKLGDNRRQGSPPDSHAKAKNENRIQDDVGHRPQKDGAHPHLSKALGINEAVHSKPYHDKYASQKIDGDVGVGKGICRIAGPKGIEKGLLKEQTKHSEKNPENHQHGKGIPHNLLCLFQVSPPPLNGTQRGTSHSEQIGKGDYHGDHGQGQPDSGQREGGMFRYPSYINPVHNIVEDIDQLGQCHGNCQT
ncbi:uncharacterized protein BN500_01136 [Clostridium sp. CAG:149]|nr:uncharacterized protein BN500_01136 [Clostridium sp. CAG:149]